METDDWLPTDGRLRLLPSGWCSLWDIFRESMQLQG